MALGFVSAGTFDFDASAPTPNYPATPDSANDIYLVDYVRPATAQSPTISGWTKIDEQVGATFRTTTYKKDTVTGSESGTVTVTHTSSPTAALAGMIQIGKAAGKVIDIAFGFGEETNAGANWTTTSGVVLGETTGDIMYAAFVGDVNANMSGQTITATGATYGTATERAEVGSSTGPIRGGLVERPITSGTASAATVHTATCTARTGQTVFLRMREADAGGATQDIAPTGIASAEAIGSATVTTGAVTVSPSGIATAQAFGTAVLTAGAVSLAPSGIGSAEAFGTASVNSNPSQDIAPAAIASVEAFGSPVLSVGGVTVAPAGIAGAEAFGTTTVTNSPPPTREIVATGIPSEEEVPEGADVHRVHRRVLRTPTVEERLRSLTGQPQPWSVNQGITLLKIDGTYHQVRWPTDDDIASASVVYRGGFDIEVDDAEVTDLTSAGYGDNIHLVLA